MIPPPTIDFDILSHVFSNVFSNLDPRRKEGQTASVSASRVCWAWNVLASVAIWDARPRWELYDLFHVLFPDPPPLNATGTVIIEKMKEYLRALLGNGTEPPHNPVA